MLGKRESEHYDYPILSIYDDIIQPNEFKQMVKEVEFPQKKSILYFHIPFCAKQCIFCNYYKISDLRMIGGYFSCLEKEIKYYASSLKKNIKIIGIHFGGGTPSVVPVKFYTSLIDLINAQFVVDESAVVSFEGNINTLCKKSYLNELKTVGINRISFGIQTFNQDIRNKYGLSGNRETIVRLCDILHSVGLEDYNADIMFNFPGQSVSEVYENVLEGFDLGINAIDLYSLLVYPETQMYYLLKKEKLWKEYSDKKNINKYELLFKKLANEPSYSFTMSNTIARKVTKENLILNTQLGNNQHNSGNVIGIGASARGYLSGLKYKNFVDIKEYMTSVDEYSLGVQLARKLTDLEISDRCLVMAPNFMKIDASSKNISEKNKTILGWLEQNRILTYKDSKYVFNLGMNFWAGNVSALMMSPQEKLRMQNIVLKNRKNHLNMYNQDKLQIIEENING